MVIFRELSREELLAQRQEILDELEARNCFGCEGDLRRRLEEIDFLLGED